MTQPTDQSSREQEREATLKDIRWRINDVRDMLIESKAFNGERLYGIDEWSTPAVNLASAIAKLDALIATLPPTAITAEEAGREGDGWLPIDSAPIGKQMLVVQAFDVTPYENGRKYTSDPYCVWQPVKGHFERWPHPFDPTHYMKLLPAPAQSGGQG